jgi:DNA-binding transcriptional regulator YhcF (GntR family)
MDNGLIPIEPKLEQQRQSSLSYKFQRLREDLRLAIARRELSGKLPGERDLAKRFRVNAKTLSKALTDLAAEGLLERSIGRGTFIKGSAPAISAAKRCLVICEEDQIDSDTVRSLKQACGDLDLVSDLALLRPSFFNQFATVIVLAYSIPNSLILDMVLRNVTVVVVGREPQFYSTHAVVFDRPLAASLAARHLMLNGHRRLAAVEPRQSTVVANALRQSVLRQHAGTTVDSCFPEEAAMLARDGVSAFVCYSADSASEVKKRLEAFGYAIPAQVAVMAMGFIQDDPVISGYYLQRAEKTKAIFQLLQQQNAHPTTIWLSGQFVDCGTVATHQQHTDAAAPPAMHELSHPADLLGKQIT